MAGHSRSKNGVAFARQAGRPRLRAALILGREPTRSWIARNFA